MCSERKVYIFVPILEQVIVEAAVVSVAVLLGGVVVALTVVAVAIGAAVVSAVVALTVVTVVAVASVAIQSLLLLWVPVSVRAEPSTCVIVYMSIGLPEGNHSGDMHDTHQADESTAT